MFWSAKFKSKKFGNPRPKKWENLGVGGGGLGEKKRFSRFPNLFDCVPLTKEIQPHALKNVGSKTINNRDVFSSLCLKICFGAILFPVCPWQCCSEWQKKMIVSFLKLLVSNLSRLFKLIFYRTMVHIRTQCDFGLDKSKIFYNSSFFCFCCWSTTSNLTQCYLFFHLVSFEHKSKFRL